MPSLELEIVPTNAAYERVCQQALHRFTARQRRAVRISQHPSTHDPIVVSSVLDMPKSTRGRWLVFTGGQSAAVVGMRMANLPARGSTVQVVAHEDRPSRTTIQRLIGGYIAGDSPRIIDASWDGDHFTVLSHELKRIQIPQEKLTRWLGSDPRKLEKFELNSSGSYVHWPHADAHFGWEQFNYLIDPAAVAAAKNRSSEYNVRYGNAIRKVREQHELRQQDLGITPRHVGRIERGESPATAKALRAFAKAHRLSVEDYLSEVAAAIS